MALKQTPTTCSSRDHRSRLLPITLFITLLALPFDTQATPLLTLEDQSTSLFDHIQKPDTIVLIVKTQEDIPLAQKILTEAFGQDQPAIILLEIPESYQTEIILRRAAKRFFKSDFSRDRVFFLKAIDNPYPKSKTLLLSPDTPTPISRSQNLLGRSDLGREPTTRTP